MDRRSHLRGQGHFDETTPTQTRGHRERAITEPEFTLLPKIQLSFKVESWVDVLLRFKTPLEFLFFCFVFNIVFRFLFAFERIVKLEGISTSTFCRVFFFSSGA